LHAVACRPALQITPPAIRQKSAKISCAIRPRLYKGGMPPRWRRLFTIKKGAAMAYLIKDTIAVFAIFAICFAPLFF
jgi:hypothetical protein